MPLQPKAANAAARLRRVLIVSPNFPPINAADHQRIRTSLPYFERYGWTADVLCVQPRFIDAPVDTLLDRTVPVDIAVYWTRAFSARITRPFGLGSLALRALPFLWARGSALLRSGVYDLIYFSTTMFPVLVLGPLWKRTFGIPYVADFQDPWLTDYYELSGVSPPGGHLKHSFHQWIARRFEPRVMRDVAETVVVSPSYVTMLRDRYPWLAADSFTVLPFGAPENDFELLPTLNIRQRLFTKGDGMLHWIYVGRGGPDMAAALRLLFGAIAASRRQNVEAWSRVRLHFAGTDYAPQGTGKQTVAPIAADFGISDLVSEETDRQPYFETLQALVDSDGLLMIGSDSPAYTPSKLYPYVLAKRPLLAVMHNASPGVVILRECRAADVIAFSSDGAEIGDNAQSAVARMLLSGNAPPETDWARFSEYSARAMTEQQCRVFNRAIMQAAA